MEGREKKLPFVSTSGCFGCKEGGYGIIRKGCCAILRSQNRRKLNNFHFCFHVYRYRSLSVSFLWAWKLVNKTHFHLGIKVELWIRIKCTLVFLSSFTCITCNYILKDLAVSTAARLEPADPVVHRPLSCYQWTIGCQGHLHKSVLLSSLGHLCISPLISTEDHNELVIQF